MIEAAAQGSGAQQDMMTSYYRDDMTRLPEMGVVARQLWETSGLGPDDMQCAVLYDHFTPFVLYQLEELGFCEWGEAKEFLRDGHIVPGRQAAHQHPRRPAGRGLHPRHERHRRGRPPGAGQAVNQVDGLEHVVVTAGTGVPTSGLVLGVDRR